MKDKAQTAESAEASALIQELQAALRMVVWLGCAVASPGNIRIGECTKQKHVMC